MRADPIVGNAPDGDGTRQHVVVDESTLATTIQVIYGNLGVLRDLPAAIASSRAGDNRPLLRLVAENGLDVDYGADPTSFSEALYLSVICHDYPQPWPAGTPLSARAATAQATFAGLPGEHVRPVLGRRLDRPRQRGRAGLRELAAVAVARPIRRSRPAPPIRTCPR